jgi:phage shock protein PspC (stress-responsive transcriptional regulator)
MKRLFKSTKDRKICGVCGGLAEYLNVDPSVIRILWVIFACMGGMGLLAYFVCAVILPNDTEVQ